MELNYFRDRLFDLLNDSERMGIADLNADERNGRTTANRPFITDEGLSKNRRRRFFYKGTGWKRLVFLPGIKSP